MSSGPPDAPDLSTAWYAVRTRSRHEKSVRDRLAGRDVEVFLPLYGRWSRWKDRRKRIESPLFPGYCFVRIPWSERLRVLEVNGVAGFVGITSRAEPLRDSEIDAIQRLVTSEYRYDPHPFLKEGMEVEVVRGPLAGVRGRLVRKDQADRLVLSVTLIQQAAALHIHPADIVPV